MRAYLKSKPAVGKTRHGGYTIVEVAIDDTVPVTGWPNRYRSTGTALVEPVLRGEAYNQAFEVIAELRARNVVRVLETKLVGPAY